MLERPGLATKVWNAFGKRDRPRGFRRSDGSAGSSSSTLTLIVTLREAGDPCCGSSQRGSAILYTVKSAAGGETDLLVY